MFADDTFGLKADSNLLSLINDLNKDINKMAIWFKANKLAVNISKTKYIIFKTKGKKLPNVIPPIIYDENEPNMPFNNQLITEIERYHNQHVDPNCRAYKLLGIYLDENLSLDQHVHKLLNQKTEQITLLYKNGKKQFKL